MKIAMKVETNRGRLFFFDIDIILCEVLVGGPNLGLQQSIGYKINFQATEVNLHTQMVQVV